MRACCCRMIYGCSYVAASMCCLRPATDSAQLPLRGPLRGYVH